MRMLNPISVEWSLPRRRLSPAWRTDSLADFDRLVESFFQPTTTSTEFFQPSCDVQETKDHYLLSFDMPGVKKEDIKIDVQGNSLTISGERHREVKSENTESTWHFERSYGKFERSFSLPSTVATEKIEAQYEDGVLNIALPKAEVAKGRTIQIQSGQEGFFSKLLGTKKDNKKVSENTSLS